MTGTPVENHPNDLISLFAFVRRTLLYHGIAVGELHARIRPHFLRRTKSEVLTELPPILIQDLSIQLNGEQLAAYEDLWNARMETLGKSARSSGDGHLFALITQLKQLCNVHPPSGESAKFDALNMILENLVVFRSPFFRDIVEMERSTLSLRSRKLFTLSALYHATSALLEKLDLKDLESGVEIAASYWQAVSEHMTEWRQVREGKMAASEVRRDFIHSHGIVLHALGTVGNILLRDYQATWKKRLRALRRIDWSRSNGALWEGRAMTGGRVSKAGQNVTLTTNAIKKELGLKLTAEEQRVERATKRRQHGSRKRPKATIGV